MCLVTVLMRSPAFQQQELDGHRRLQQVVPERRCMFYGESVSPPREPPRKKFVIPKKAAATMPDSGASGSTTSGGVRESTLLWPMLSRMNYSEWSMLMQCNYEAMEI